MELRSGLRAGAGRAGQRSNWSMETAGDGGLVDRPKRGFALVGRSEAVGSAGQALGHAQGEAEIDGQGNRAREANSARVSG